MNKIQTYISTFIAVSGICFTSCTNDNNIDWNGVEVTNTELRTILQQKGYTFNAEGKLVQDDKVKSRLIYRAPKLLIYRDWKYCLTLLKLIYRTMSMAPFSTSPHCPKTLLRLIYQVIKYMILKVW